MNIPTGPPPFFLCSKELWKNFCLDKHTMLYPYVISYHSGFQ